MRNMKITTYYENLNKPFAALKIVLMRYQPVTDSVLFLELPVFRPGSMNSKMTSAMTSLKMSIMNSTMGLKIQNQIIHCRIHNFQTN